MFLVAPIHVVGNTFHDVPPKAEDKTFVLCHSYDLHFHLLLISFQAICSMSSTASGLRRNPKTLCSLTS